MITARSIMTENVITVNENAALSEAAKLIIKKRVSCLLVTNKNKPIAIVTENDLVKGSVDKSKNKVKDVMTKQYMVVNPGSNYSSIIQTLKKGKVKRFPVVENERLVGLITETDILDATRDFTRFHQIMQEVILAVFGIVTAFFLFFFSPLGSSLFRG